MSRHVLLLVPALLAACSSPFGTSSLGTPTFGTGPAGAVPVAQRDARYEACLAEATRIVQFRERGQTMRSDETESSRGTVTVSPYFRAESDRMRAQMDRDAMVQECLRGSQGAGMR